MTTVADLTARTNAIRKAIRTVLQTVVAAAPAVALSVTNLLPAEWAAVVLGVMVPIVAYAHNLLEDKGIVGTWLRRPTPVTIEAAAKAVGLDPSVADQLKASIRERSEGEPGER